MKQVAFIIILCTSLSCNAQTADPHSVYEKFKQQAKQEYSALIPQHYNLTLFISS